MKSTEPKIIHSVDFQRIRDNIRVEGKTVVMCHGVYDLLHFGHLEHLKDAKRQGDVLVVSITSAPFVNKGPDRPYYNDQQRMQFLSSLEMVDYVILSEEPTAKTNIKTVQPDVFVKGSEFQHGEDGITGNVRGEIELVKELGGRIYFSQGEVHSSSKLLNNYFNALPDEVLESVKLLKHRHGDNLFEKITGWVDGFTKLKVLVVGDIIIDDYIFCQAQGLTSKDTVISTRYETEERYWGGSLAIARHIAQFSEEVTFMSMMGTSEGELREQIDKSLSSKLKLDITVAENFVTPVKRRYLKRHPQREEYDKLFSLNILLPKGEVVDYRPFCEQLKEKLQTYDLVVLCDYGHGLIVPEVQAIIEEKSKYLALNCQTNSSNYGMNLITKYKRADMLALDEKELRLPFGQAMEAEGILLERLMGLLGAQRAWVTLGAKGALALDNEYESCLSPALTLHVKDTVGAGDAFYSIASLCSKIDVPLDVSTLLGNAAGALKTHMVGNSSSVGKRELLKFVKTVLMV